MSKCHPHLGSLLSFFALGCDRSSWDACSKHFGARQMLCWNKWGIWAGTVTSCYDGSAEGWWQKPDAPFFKILRAICQWSLYSVLSQSKRCHRSVSFWYCISQQNWGCGREGEGLPPCSTSRPFPKTSWAVAGASIPLQGRSNNQKPCPQLCKDEEERNGEITARYSPMSLSSPSYPAHMRICSSDTNRAPYTLTLR